jgi:NADH:ubiquinone oxidoreductase subunit C
MVNKVRSSSPLSYSLLAHYKLGANFVSKSLVDLFAVDDVSTGTLRVIYIVQDSAKAQKINLELHHGRLSRLITCVNVFPGLSWLEREVWDMFGIFFWGNADLRRILTAYGFVGHPLAKDFPLSGFKEV